MSLLDMLSQPWALHEPVFEDLQAVVLRHFEGVKIPAAEVESIVANAPARQRQAKALTRSVPDDVAVIPVRGVIAKHASQVGGASQPAGTSVEQIREQVDAAMADNTKSGILLDVDSPGGSVDGVWGLVEDLRAMRGEKPIVAHVDSLMASAGYAIGSAADEVIANPHAVVGSIGVYSVVHDISRRAQAAGIDVHVVKAGERKGDMVPGAPVTKDQLARAQASVDQHYAWFVDGVAANRGMTPGAATKVATGETWFAEGALERGLIDGVGSFAAAVDRIHELAGGVEPTASTGSPLEGDDMSEKTVARLDSVEALRAEYPHLAEKIANQGFSEGVKVGAADERERCLTIVGCASANQADKVATLIEEGAKTSAAVKVLREDPRRDAADTLRAASDASPDAPPQNDPPKAADAPKLVSRDPLSDESLKAEFEKAEDADRFPSFEAWASLRRQEIRHQIAVSRAQLINSGGGI